MATIPHWNINGYYTHLEMLKVLLNEINPRIICLQETHFKQGKRGELKNYNCFSKSRINARKSAGGVAIYVLKDIDALEMKLNSPLEVIAI